jgi:hypothetical protein
MERMMKSLLCAVLVGMVACAGSVEPAPSPEQDAVTERAASEAPEPPQAKKSATSSKGNAAPSAPAAAPSPGVFKTGACENPKEVVDCTLEGGVAGTQVCDDRPKSEWTVCAAPGECKPGEYYDCRINGVMAGCVIEKGRWSWNHQSCNTPLALSFDSAPIQFTRPNGFFDVVGDGKIHQTDWISAETPWLVFDRNGNGIVDNGSELFGSMTMLANGKRAEHGFAALSDLDDNHDGRITPADASFAKLMLWRDFDQNRQSSLMELTPLAGAGVTALNLDYVVKPRCEAKSCEVERAPFEFTAGGTVQHGTVVDVHFATDDQAPATCSASR